MTHLKVAHQFATLFIVAIEDQFNEFRAMREISQLGVVDDIDGLDGPSDLAAGMNKRS